MLNDCGVGNVVNDSVDAMRGVGVADVGRGRGVKDRLGQHVGDVLNDGGVGNVANDSVDAMCCWCC